MTARLQRMAGSNRSLTIGAVRLELRPAVAVRERAAGASMYLSLYDPEIDERAEAFWSFQAIHGGLRAPEALELTDAALWIGDEGDVWVARGGACTFPLYWGAQGLRHFVSTQLPLLSGEAYSRSGLLSAVATACLHSSYEPNAFTRTPLAGWRRVRRGSVLRLARDGASVEDTIVVPRGSMPEARSGLVTELREACDAYRRSQRRVRSALLEVSGGYDSSVAALGPSTECRMLGVSAVFPYYEFRFEEAVQRASADALGIARVPLDGTQLFPYAPSETAARFDEPSLFVTGIRHAEHVARFAAEHDLQCVYTGHGGDQLFATDLDAREAPVVNPPETGPFSRVAWRSVAEAMKTIRTSPWTERSTGTFVYDARQDVWVKETFGPTLRTPFTDLALFRVARKWSAWCRARGLRVDKSLLAEALGDALPAAIRERKGKVAYDGVWMRAYARQVEHIAHTFEGCGAMLAFLGVSVSWLVKRARALAEFEARSDREVLALYALCNWLSAWGIEQPGQLCWARREERAL